MSKFAFRVDASLDIGTGHVMRCLTLAKKIESLGGEVVFICRLLKGNLIELIEKQGFEVMALSSKPYSYGENVSQLYHASWLGVTQAEDVRQCKEALGSEPVDWMIVDHYALDSFWHESMANLYKKMMVIDDLADRNHSCDILLDQNFGSSKGQYEGLVPENSSLYIGPHYALLRDEFLLFRESSLLMRKNPKLERILVSIGGVDVDNNTGLIIRKIAASTLPEDIEITIVLGPTAPHLKDVEHLASSCKFKTDVKVGVNNMAELMSYSDLAIGAAGSTTWERFCLGVPTIQIIVAENQKTIARKLAAEGLVISLDDIKDLPEIIASFRRYCTELTNRSSSVCDGEGAARVAKRLVHGE